MNGYNAIIIRINSKISKGTCNGRKRIFKIKKSKIKIPVMPQQRVRFSLIFYSFEYIVYVNRPILFVKEKSRPSISGKVSEARVTK